MIIGILGLFFGIACVIFAEFVDCHYNESFKDLKECERFVKSKIYKRIEEFNLLSNTFYRN